MKYFIRSVKYFIYFAVIFVLIISLLLITGIAEGDLPSLFKNGYDSLYQIAACLLVISAVYPMFGYMKKEIDVAGGIGQNKDNICRMMDNYGYRLEKEDGDGKISFRHKKLLNSLFRMMEDRITIEQTPSGLRLEGLRKDVVRIATGLEYRLRGDDAENQ